MIKRSKNYGFPLSGYEEAGRNLPTPKSVLTFHADLHNAGGKIYSPWGFCMSRELNRFAEADEDQRSISLTSPPSNIFSLFNR